MLDCPKCGYSECADIGMMCQCDRCGYKYSILEEIFSRDYLLKQQKGFETWEEK